MDNYTKFHTHYSQIIPRVFQYLLFSNYYTRSTCMCTLCSFLMGASSASKVTTEEPIILIQLVWSPFLQHWGGLLLSVLCCPNSQDSYNTIGTILWESWEVLGELNERIIGTIIGIIHQGPVLARYGYYPAITIISNDCYQQWLLSIVQQWEVDQLCSK